MIGTGIGLGLSGYKLAPGNWNPSRISGLQIWLDSSDLSTLFQSSGGSAASADGDPVGLWKDKSGNGNNFEQTSGTNKPAVKLLQQNGKPGIYFDGVNDYIDSVLTLPAGSLGYSHFVVVKVLSGSSYPYIISTKTSAIPERNEIPYISPYQVNWRVGPVNFAYSFNTTYFTGYVNNIPNLTAYLNGSSGSGTWSANGNLNSILRLGQSYDFDGGARLIGYIFEVITYTKILSSTEVQNVRHYLNTKWSIY